MKKITLVLSIALLATATYGQQTVWSDDFNDEDISDWTLTDSDGDGNDWGDIFQIGDGAGGFVTPVSLISRSWSGSPLTPDNWAVTPAIDLSGAAGTINVTYVTQVAAQSWDQEKYSIHVGTSNDISVLINSATSLTEILGDAGDTGTPVSHSLDISSLAGSGTVYIAFRHWDCTDQDFLSVDDLTVTASTLSVDEFASNNFKHFYNADSKTLSLESSVALSNVEVFNILGQKIVDRALSQTNETIDFSSFEDGIYLVRTKLNEQINTFRVLKQ